MSSCDQLLVGLVCSDAELVEYYVRLITEVKSYNLKAIWSPDTERSIQIAADNDVPSVSHTAYQLISRNDINTVIIAGHSSHNALFCLQSQALKKCTVCIGAVALCERSAKLLIERCFSCSTNRLRIIYPLRYSSPWLVAAANLLSIGSLLNVCINLTYRWPLADPLRRLHCDALTMQHRIGHDLVAAVAFLCSGGGGDNVKTPKPLTATCQRCETTVEHFRIVELQSLHLQVAFGTTVASIRAQAATVNSLNVRILVFMANQLHRWRREKLVLIRCIPKPRTIIHFILGDNGCMMLDERLLVLESRERQDAVLWRGDGTFETIVRSGILNAFNDSDTHPGDCDELQLVRCLDNCVYLQ